RAYWGSRRSRSMSPGGYRQGDYRSNRDLDYRRSPWEPRDDFSRSRGRAGGRGDEPPSMDRGQDRDRDYMAARWDVKTPLLLPSPKFKPTFGTSSQKDSNSPDSKISGERFTPDPQQQQP
ncbi:hypothetical protein THAOC_33172, partial [Thalassiosira oceanica]